MKTEIRIYFECLEQLLHYILPLIKDGVSESKDEVEIKFIRKPRRLTNSEDSIAAIYSLTTPDILITLCKDKKEIPIIIGEFSEAVTTEDHELQRAMGGIAAALSKCIYIKISGQKQSLKEHGGKKDFNPLTIPKIIKSTFNYDGYIFGKWPTLDNNPYILKRDKTFLSCPPNSEILIVEETLKIAIKNVLKNIDEILNNKMTIVQVVLEDLKDKQCFKEYSGLLKKAPGLRELVDDWKSRKGKDENKEPRISFDDNRLIVKINRFSHAADPDRGILIFSSTLVPANIILTRYCVKEECLKKEKLMNAFIKQATEEVLPKDFITNLSKHLRRNLDESVDITKFININKKQWEKNKVLYAIFLFSDGMVIHDKKNKCRFQLLWRRKSIFKTSGKVIKLLEKIFKFREYGMPLKISEVKDLNEDEVSYIVVHNILRPNNFDIVSVSYPGAQGEAAILPEKGKGRRQKRLYIDVIAWLPRTNNYFSSDITLEESKEKLDVSEMKDLIDRLDLFRTDKSMLVALIETLNRLNYRQKLEHIFIGVAFGVEDIETKWEPYKVDYLIRIFDRNKWQLACFGERLRETFKTIEGEFELPKVYRVIASTDGPELFDSIEDKEDNDL